MRVSDVLQNELEWKIDKAKSEKIYSANASEIMADPRKPKARNVRRVE